MADDVSFTDYFSTVAADYAHFRPDYPDTLFDHLARIAPGHDLAWDCATGNGQAAQGLVGHFARIHATDASAAQIAAATPHPRIRYAVAPAESSGLAEVSCDLVTVAQALHWFDLPRFLDEARRVLRPGGILAVWCYGPHRLDDPALEAVSSRFYHDIVGPYWPPERALVESAYAMLDFPGFEELPVPALELSHAWPLATLLGYMGTWSATQGYRKATGKDPLPSLADDLARHWGDPSRPRRIQWPLGLRLLRRP